VNERDDEGVLPPFGGDEARSSYERARAVVLPVPYEGTVSYGHGTSLGPAAILRASTQVELYDEQLGLEPYRAGIFTDPMLDVRERSTEDVVARVKRRAGELLDDGKWMVMLGGEHSITPGAVAAAAERHDGLHVLQLDAHADLRQTYEGSPLSHACAMARCVELAPVHAVGIRNYSREEADWIRKGIPGYRIVHGWEMEGEAWIDRVLRPLAGRSVYLTFDIDYFDPSIVPATGTPEPGGGTWWPTVRFLDRLFAEARIVAADVVELAPVEGLHHADFTAARLVHKLIGLATR
jgi:agmatinase